MQPPARPVPFLTPSYGGLPAAGLGQVVSGGLRYSLIIKGLFGNALSNFAPVSSVQVPGNGVPGTLIVDTDGYTGGAGNRRFRIYYWLNPPPGLTTVVVTNPPANTTPNELAVSVVLLDNVSQANPLGAIALDVSTSARTEESETAPTTTNDLVVHVIADALFVRGTLGDGETSRSVANDGRHFGGDPNLDGDASLWIATKPGERGSTTVSSSGWASRVINGAAIVVHGP